MADGWQFILGLSSTREVLARPFNCHDRVLSVDMNKSGSASYWLPSSDKAAPLTVPWKTCLLAYHDDELYWSGPVLNRSTQMSTGRTTVNCVGWFDLLMGLSLREEVTYTNKDAGEIVAALMVEALEQDPRLPIHMGSVIPTQTRTITYTRDQNIGQAILDLVELESGIDWHIDPQTLLLHIYARRGQDRPNCKWTFIGDGISQQSNLADCVEFVDGATVVNEIFPRGMLTSGYAEDPVSKAEYFVHQETPSLADVPQLEILNAYGNAEMIYRAQPRVTYALSPKPSSKATVPKLLRTFDLGDTGRLTIRRDFIDVVDQPVRMFGAGLSISDVGTETITNLQTSLS